MIFHWPHIRSMFCLSCVMYFLPFSISLVQLPSSFDDTGTNKIHLTKLSLYVVFFVSKEAASAADCS